MYNDNLQHNLENSKCAGEVFPPCYLKKQKQKNRTVFKTRDTHHN